MAPVLDLASMKREFIKCPLGDGDSPAKRSEELQLPA
jgi:hypothetical protein